MKWLLLALIPLGIFGIGAIAVTPVSQQNPPMILQELNELEERVETLESETESLRVAIEVVQEGNAVAFATPGPLPTKVGTPIPTISPDEIAYLTFKEACINGTLPFFDGLRQTRWPNESSEWGVGQVPGMFLGGLKDITGGRAPIFEADGTLFANAFVGPILGSEHDFEKDGKVQVCLKVSEGYAIQFLDHPYGSSDAPNTVFPAGYHYLEGGGEGKYSLRVTGLKNSQEVVMNIVEYQRCRSTVGFC